MFNKLLVVFAVVLLAFFTVDISVADEGEVNVLIDVSGSMKENDPNNLRIPALKLMINLLPDGHKAGIWMFAEQTTVLVESGVVDQQWKERALKAVEKVHSRGLFTDIEDALKVSSQEWLKQTAPDSRNLILLTDGVVDVSSDIDESDASRERILSEMLPLLQQAGVKIQTIALSEQADKELLKKLSVDSNGWNETLQSADQLQRSFLKMFKKSVPQETVPIKDNKFNVDVTIKEFSVLVFKKPGSPATKLIMPDQKKIVNFVLPEGASWLDEDGYDLITIKNPMPGEWKIDADVDLDNQVMIVTDLQMKTNELPNQLSEQESLAVTVHFTDNGNLITRSDFLSILKLTLQQEDALGRKSEWTIEPMVGQAGYFSRVLDKTLTKGINVVRLKVDGKTFIRELEQTIEVVDSPIAIEPVVNEGHESVTFKLIPDTDIIDSSSMEVKVILNTPPAQPETFEVPTKEGEWSFNVDISDKKSRKIVNFLVQAKTVLGNEIKPNIHPFIIDEKFLQSQEQQNKLIAMNKNNQKPEQKMDEPKQENKVVEPIKESKAVEKTKPEDEKTKEKTDWLKTGSMIAVVNVLLFGSGFFGYRLYRKKTQAKKEELLNKLTS